MNCQEIIRFQIWRLIRDFQNRLNLTALAIGGQIQKFSYDRHGLNTKSMSQSQSQSKNFALSTKGLTKIPKCEERDDFTFIVGNHRYFCPKIIADFLSPRLCKLHAVDCSICEFSIETRDAESVFGSFIDFGFGHSVEISDSELGKFISLCRELWNQEFYDALVGSDLTQSNAIERLEFHEGIEGNSEIAVGFIASNFSDFSIEELKRLGLSAICAIVHHRSLKLLSEDSLYDFVAGLVERDLVFFALFEAVRFEYLSVDRISKFFDFTIDSLELIDRLLWSSLKGRFVLPVEPTIPIDWIPSRQSAGVCVESRVFAPTAPLRGIISHLSERCGGNVHDHGLVTITANRPTNDHPNYARKKAADLTTNSYFHSANEPNQWICSDFNRMKVNPTHYSIRSYYGGGVNSHHLKTWTVEGSNDGTVWIRLDDRTNNGELNCANAVATFAISQSQSVRLIRLQQTGPDHYGCNSLILCSFEVFGTLLE
jgi:hypothetical protein